MSTSEPNSSQATTAAAQLFRRANEALRREQFDYVEELMGSAVRLNPGLVTYRQFLRGAQYKKYNDNGTGARMAGVRLSGTKAKIKKAKLQKDWAEVDKQCEEGMTTNPWDVSLLSDLGLAARERGFPEVAIDSYGRAVKEDGNNVDLLRTLATLYTEEQKWDEAIAVWERVMKLLPNDGEARTQIGHCHTNKAIGRNFEEDSGSDDSSMNEYDRDHAARSSKAQALSPGDDPEEDLKREIRKDPENKDLYVKYANFLRRAKRLTEAEEQFAKALKLSGGDAAIREQMEDTELQRMDIEYEELLDKERKSDGDQDVRAARIRLKQKRIQRRATVLTAREQRYTNDMMIKFQLATLFMNVKQYDKAIPRLQQAQNDVRIAGKALVKLGLCFLLSEEDRNTKLAGRSLEKAIEKLDPQDDLDEFLEAHYWLGRISEQSGNADAAEEHYNDVLQRDYNYKDVRDRLKQIAEM